MGSSRLLTYAPVLAGLGLMAAPVEAALPNCNVGALAALNVPNVTIISVADVPASPSNPEFCDVLGTLRTTGFGAPDGSARFEIKLPATWNGKFLFLGVGGFAGSLNPAVNPVDFIGSLGLGYATAVTDTGHSAGATDARWALNALGQPDEAKITDYYFRAAHQVTAAGKELVSRYYRGSIRRAYFDGCSNGGRMAFVEATKFPKDYDGIIAGAPFLDIRAIIAGAKFQKVQLSPATYIPATRLPAVDAAVYAACDAVDGVTDGLIQNPAKCSFNPNQLVPDTLTSDQAKTLTSYISALRDDEGNVIYEGAAITDLNAGGGMDLWATGFVAPISFTDNEPWATDGFAPSPLTWQFADNFLKYVVERTPTFDLRHFGVSTNGVVSEQALKLFDERSEAGDGDVPAQLLPFIAQKRKLLIYHGFSDPALSPFRTIRYYEDLANITRGFNELQEHVRLFMVPGMQHCGGGPGPNVFDTLTALDNWVEHGVAPNGIVASHFTNNNPAQPVDRTMPLCKFPEQAVYNGSGPVKSASSWQCTRNHRLLELGANGRTAGLGDDDSDRDHDH
jgi:Tannase and feruloyl esterase